MRRLILFRHSEAVHSPRYRDLDRPLTEAGRKDASRVGVHLAALNLGVDLVLVSPSQRARETWEIAGPQIASESEIRVDKKIYEADRRDLMEIARALPDWVNSVMIVGHNPSIAEFATHFAGGGERDALKQLGRGFPTSAVAVFDTEDVEWRKLRWGDGALSHFLT